MLRAADVPPLFSARTGRGSESFEKGSSKVRGPANGSFRGKASIPSIPSSPPQRRLLHPAKRALAGRGNPIVNRYRPGCSDLLSLKCPVEICGKGIGTEGYR